MDRIVRWSLRAERSPRVFWTWRTKLLQVEGFAEVAAALTRGESAAVDGAWGSSSALAVAALAESTDRTILVVLPRSSDLDDFAADVLGFLGAAPEILPAWETLPQEFSLRDAVYGGRSARLGVWRTRSRRGLS